MTKSQAESIGRTMKARLGKGWKITVHENCGWWVHANKGPLYVSGTQYRDSEEVTYMCLMSSDPVRFPNCGEVYWTVRHGKTHTDPLEAIAEQVEVARDFVDRNLKAVEEAEAELSQHKCSCCGKKRYEKPA